MGKYANTDLNRVPSEGGSVRVTIPATPFQVQANDGTSVPCKRVWIVAPNGSSNIRVQIGAACTATTGIPVPEMNSSGTDVTYLHLPIEDVSSLYFIGEAENDVVDILYTR